MTICPKCDYERRPEDDGFTPEGECPKCGLIYEKFRPAAFSVYREPASPPRQAKAHGPKVFKALLLVGLALISWYGWQHYPKILKKTGAIFAKSDFVAIPKVKGAQPNEVIVFGPD